MSKLSAAVTAALLLGATHANAETNIPAAADRSMGYQDKSGEIKFTPKGKKLWACAMMSVDVASSFAIKVDNDTLTIQDRLIYINHDFVGDDKVSATFSSAAVYNPAEGTVSFNNVILRSENGETRSSQSSSVAHSFTLKTQVLDQSEPQGSFDDVDRLGAEFLQSQRDMQRDTFVRCVGNLAP